MDSTEQKIIQRVEEHRDEIVAFARDIFHHAELGFKEYRTAGKFRELLEGRVDRVEDGLALTGVKGYLNENKKEHFSLALLGEMDALKIPSYRDANPETGGAHCCGHHAQLAGVAGALLALSDPEIAQKLDGQVVFFAVPAEEYGEAEFKNELIRQGKITYGGGKCELIRIGADNDHYSIEEYRVDADGEFYDGSDYDTPSNFRKRTAAQRSVKDICRMAGMTQTAMADYFSIPQRTFGNWCTGTRECPEYTKLMMQELLGLYRR